MTDPTTTSVLADVAAWVIAALVLGFGAYQARRALMPLSDWSLHGKVDAGAYRAVDGVVVLGLAWLMWRGLRSQSEGVQPESAVEAALHIAGETAVQGPGISEMLANALFLMMICLGLLFYLRQIRGLDPVALFGLRRLSAPRVVAAAVLWLLPLLAVVTACNWLTLQWLKQFWPDLAPQEAITMFLEQNHAGSRAIMIVSAVLIAPLVEEVVFRGFVYGAVKRFTDPIFAGLASAALFALAHFHLGSVVPLFVLALGFTAAYERTGSLLVPMLMHGLFNALSLAALMVMEREG